MAYFKVSLNGQNFWLNHEKEPTRMGFYTTRFVVADNDVEAENMAVQMIREDSKFQRVLNQREDPPMIYCEGIEKVQAFEPSSVVQKGFVFYKEDTDS